LTCDSAVVKGNVYLRNGFAATGTVCMNGAQIGGNFECTAGKFDGKDGNALLCDGALIKGSVFLKKDFTATGTVCMTGAQIGGNLECTKGKFDGKEGEALVAAGMTVAGEFCFKNLSGVKGGVSLIATKVGSLIDDFESWPKELNLDGFVYGRLAVDAPTDAETRLEWLKKQPALHLDGKDFKPQPWWQLQKVLRDMGHLEDARQVAIALEDQLRTAKLIGQTPGDWCKPIAGIYRIFSRIFHWLFGWLIGYGYRPLGLFFKMLVVWLLCGAFYWCAAFNGVFAPSNPLIFQNPKYAACVPASPAAKLEGYKSGCGLPSVQGAGNWYLCSNLPEEYTGFSPLAYSLDLILPLVDLQQEHDWVPMIPTPKDTWPCELSMWCLKHFTRFVVWLEILFGWVSSLLLVAVVSGLTKRREE